MLLRHTAGISRCSRQSSIHQASISGAGPQCALHKTAILCKSRLTTRALRCRCTPGLSSTSEPYDTDKEAFDVLKALTPVCTADIATPASGVRGLVASTRLSEGQTVLFVPNVNSLSVATGGGASVAAWRDGFLRPWEQNHGPLPAALVEFIADTRWESTTRLAAWLLYLKKFRTNGINSSNTLWQSWLALLPGTDEAANACGLWTPEELQQLQLEPFKGLMTSVNSLTAAVCHEAFDHMRTGALGQLQLADTVDDVMWGAFVARTRATSAADAVTLRPMHDMLNHAEQPNASCYITNDGYAIEAVSDIPAGSEITISYTGDETLAPDLNLGTSSLELLMTWGFTQGPGVQDMILPMQYQALPALDWETLVAAAAAAVKTQQGMTAGFGLHQAARVGGDGDQLMRMMQAAVGNLPVGQRSSRDGAFYNRAAETVSKYGMLGCSCADVANAGSNSLMLVSNTSGSAAAVHGRSLTSGSSSRVSSLDAAVQQMAPWLVYERPYLTQLHLREMQSEFVSEVCESLPVLQRTLLLAGSPGSSSTVALAQVPLAFMQWVSSTVQVGYEGTGNGRSSSGLSSNSSSSMRLLEQALVARAVSCEVQFMLLQCGSTIQQDEAVLQFLQTFNSAESPAPPAPSLNSAYILASQPQQQRGPSDLQLPVSLSNKLSSSRVLGSHSHHKLEVPQQSFQMAGQQGIQSFKQCQLDTLSQLMLLNADTALQTSLPEADVAALLAVASHNEQYKQQPARRRTNSPAPANAFAVAVVASSAVLPPLQPVMKPNISNHWASSTGLAAGWTTASTNVPPSLTAQVKVISALCALGCSDKLSGNRSASAQRISDLLTGQEQKLGVWQRQQDNATNTCPAAACEAAVAEVAGLLMSGQACKQRLMAAVAARLQHKRLLHTYDTLLKQVLEQLDQTPVATHERR